MGPAVKLFLALSTIVAGAEVFETDVSGGEVSSADFSDVVVTSAEISSPDITEFSRAKGNEVKAESAEITGADITEFTRAEVNDVKASGAEISSAKTFGAKISSAEVPGTEVSRIKDSRTCTKPKLSIPAGVLKDTNFYILREGHSFEVFCSGDTNELVIEKNAQKIQTHIVNRTTVKVVIEPVESYDQYKCHHTCSSTTAVVLTESYPEIISFDCESKNFEFLNCAWRVTTDFVDYLLSYNLVKKTFKTELCKNDLSNRKYYSCVWDVDYKEKDGLYVTIDFQICNILDCFNQTRYVDAIAVTKLNAPRNLKISDITSHGALLEWTPYNSSVVSQVELYFTIEYMFPGIKPHELTSNTTVAWNGRGMKHYLNFPCSDREYTIRVSCRPAKVLKEHMSDFASISFRSEPETEERPLDPICEVESVDVILYKIRELRKYFSIELNKIKKLGRVLNGKKTTVESMSQQLKVEGGL